MIKTTRLAIRGMTCAACATASERAVRKLPGVAEASVNFATERLSVSWDDAALSLDAVKAAVAKAGYETVDDVEAREISLPIGGMSCASCAAAVAAGRAVASSRQARNLRGRSIGVSREHGIPRTGRKKRAGLKLGRFGPTTASCNAINCSTASTNASAWPATTALPCCCSGWEGVSFLA